MTGVQTCAFDLDKDFFFFFFLNFNVIIFYSCEFEIDVWMFFIGRGECFPIVGGKEFKEIWKGISPSKLLIFNSIKME